MPNPNTLAAEDNLKEEILDLVEEARDRVEAAGDEVRTVLTLVADAADHAVTLGGNLGQDLEATLGAIENFLEQAEKLLDGDADTGFDLLNNARRLVMS